MSETITQIDADVKANGLRTLLDIPGLLWLDLDDPMSHALDDLAARYVFHELAVEDCRHAIQLAKVDYYDGYSFIIINSTHYTERPCELRIREIDAFIGTDYIVTVHYGESLSIKEIERRLATKAMHLDRPDEVLHAIIDIVVDRYLPTLESIGDTIDRVEDDLLIHPDATLLQTIFELKRGMLQFRRAVSSQRELLNVLIRDDTRVISKDMRIYFRDVYDHAVRAMDLVETYRDLLTGGLDIYLTQMANRTNDIVKGLTILATIMLPLTLVTGYFGMNFEYMPWLKDPNGVWYTTGGMAVITVSMLAYFKYKKWL
ncbi:MAG TPA: magnesium/cobalt transporter CorA [Blastocatellia bacterium]|nr:magnesium/cobalt transporter CorA [Blastocatellia bacterium]